MNRSHKLPVVPTAITLFRITCIFPILYTYSTHNYGMMIFFIGCGLFSDLLDGYVARWLAQESYLGALLDPLADKLFMATLFTMFTWQFFVLPAWFWYLFIAKELLLMVGAAHIWLHFPGSSLKANFWGKLAMVLQSILVVIISWHIVSTSGAGIILHLLVYVVSAVMLGALYSYSAQFLYRWRFL